MMLRLRDPIDDARPSDPFTVRPDGHGYAWIAGKAGTIVSQHPHHELLVVEIDGTQYVVPKRIVRLT